MRKLYRVTDYKGAESVVEASNESEALAFHIKNFPYAVGNDDKVVEELGDELSELDIFQNLARYSWLKKGMKFDPNRQITEIMPLKELKEEILDIANYLMVLYWKLTDLAESVGYHEIERR